MRLGDVFKPYGLSSGTFKSGPKGAGNLLEMPQTIEDSNFGFDDEHLNRKWAQTQLTMPKEVIEETEDYILFRTGNLSEGHIGLYNKHTDLLGYAMEYETNDNAGLGQSATQVSLWRSLDDPFAGGVTSRIFFDYLLKKWPMVMSDSRQTDRGKEFWIRQMATAVNKGFKVGLADFEKHDVDWFDGKPGDFAKWRTTTQAWGVDRSYQGLRYIIANK